MPQYVYVEVRGQFAGVGSPCSKWISRNDLQSLSLVASSLTCAAIISPTNEHLYFLSFLAVFSFLLLCIWPVSVFCTLFSFKVHFVWCKPYLLTQFFSMLLTFSISESKQSYGHHNWITFHLMLSTLMTRTCIHI